MPYYKYDYVHTHENTYIWANMHTQDKQTLKVGWLFFFSFSYVCTHCGDSKTDLKILSLFDYEKIINSPITITICTYTRKCICTSIHNINIHLSLDDSKTRRRQNGKSVIAWCVVDLLTVRLLGWATVRLSCIFRLWWYIIIIIIIIMNILGA